MHLNASYLDKKGKSDSDDSSHFVCSFDLSAEDFSLNIAIPTCLATHRIEIGASVILKITQEALSEQ
jgi:hypothetical protein